MPNRRSIRRLLISSASLLAAALGFAGPASGQAPRPPMLQGDGEFYFVRMEYANAFGGGRGFRGFGRGSWLTDWPEAETHLLQGLSRLTRLDTGAEGVMVNLEDEALMEYPWLYAVEVGRWQLSELEAARLREYLLRGGFLMVDDFWGTEQWDIFLASMNRVFPDRPIIELDETHELLHVLYDLDERVQIPGAGYIRSGVTWEYDGYVPHWRAILDDDGRVMVVINYNMDMGDAWEHADNPYYPEPMTTLAYRFAVNYVIYSMTH
jgi:hypothetical protein